MGGNKGDKKRRHEDIKREGKEQERRAEQMKAEADRHMKDVEALEKAAAELKAAGEEMESDRSEKDIQDLERARDSRKEKLEELKTERDKLLRENESGADIINRRQQLNRKAGSQIGGQRGKATGEVATLLDQKVESLKAEWNELNATAVVFSSAKLKLQLLKIE